MEIDLNSFPKEPGIYCFENIINGKKYIGKSVQIRRRIKEHIKQLSLGKDDCKYLQSAWNKYGKDYFSIRVLCLCDSEKLMEIEILLIKEFNSKSPNGYNLTDGGDGTSGYKWTEEQINSVIGENNPFYGRSHSDSFKKEMSERQIGDKNHNYNRKFSEETIRKMIENHSDVSGENNWNWGRHWSDEIKNKISKSLSKTITGIGNPRFGKKSDKKSSQYYGVYYNKTNNNWVAQITKNAKKIHIGTSKIESVAARKYDKYIFENSLPNPLNFPEEYK